MPEAVKKSRTEEFKQRQSFIMNSEEVNSKISNKIKEKWKQEDYRDKLKMTDEKKNKIKNSVTKKWEDEDYRKLLKERQNDKDVNLKRSKSIKDTLSKEGYANSHYKEVIAVNLINKSVLNFKNIKLANDWIKKNKTETKRGFRCDVKWMIKNNSNEFLGYKWTINR